MNQCRFCHKDKAVNGKPFTPTTLKMHERRCEANPDKVIVKRKEKKRKYTKRAKTVATTNHYESSLLLLSASVEHAKTRIQVMKPEAALKYATNISRACME